MGIISSVHPFPKRSSLMPDASPADHADKAPERASRRYDPERRRRIIASALEVIARQGVEGASIRLVAKEADVPLGSMTYP